LILTRLNSIECDALAGFAGARQAQASAANYRTSRAHIEADQGGQ
jgi:hypothetical protein